MCAHDPECPPADAAMACFAHVVAPHPEQGWCLLCNGVVLFDDGGAILPNGSTRRRTDDPCPSRGRLTWRSDPSLLSFDEDASERTPPTKTLILEIAGGLLRNPHIVPPACDEQGQPDKAELRLSIIAE